MGQDKATVCPTSIGGQAVIEGVMMRGKRLYAMAVRKPNKELEMIIEKLEPVSDKYPALGWPVIRGMAAFVSSLSLGMKILTKSAEIAGIDTDEEPTGKIDKFLEEKFGDRLMDIMMFLSILLAIGISTLLFLWLPVWISGFANRFIGDRTWVLGVLEGFTKIAIFLGYILLISRSKDIQRVFGYHGAEHKTINCFEHRQALTVENVRVHSRLHKRCGTSFLIIVMIISMFVFMFVRTNALWTRFAFKLLLIPIIAGLSYEVIKWAGRSESPIVGIISMPGMAMQKITTTEPDDSQIEAAIAAMSEILKHEPE